VSKYLQWISLVRLPFFALIFSFVSPGCGAHCIRLSGLRMHGCCTLNLLPSGKLHAGHILEPLPLSCPRLIVTVILFVLSFRSFTVLCFRELNASEDVLVVASFSLSFGTFSWPRPVVLPRGPLRYCRFAFQTPFFVFGVEMPEAPVEGFRFLERNILDLDSFLVCLSLHGAV